MYPISKRDLNKAWLFIIVLTSSRAVVYGQVQDPVSLITARAEQNRAIQKVKAEWVVVYTADKKGKIGKKGSMRNEIFYNPQGRITKVSTFFPASTTISESEYDDRGNQIKMISRTKSGAIKQSLVYEYDDNDVLRQIRNYNPNGKIVSVKDINVKIEGNYKRTYDDKGALTSSTFTQYDSLTRTYLSQIINPAGEIRYEDKYVLSPEYLIVEWRSIDNMQGKRSDIKYQYDSKGNQIEEQHFDVSGKLIIKKTMTYSDKNLILEKSEYTPTDQLLYVFKHEYTF